MNIVHVNAITDPRWHDFVQHQQSSLFHSPDWMRVIQRTYELDIHACMMLDKLGKPIAGIPYSRVHDVKGQRIVSLPFSDYCDPLVNDNNQWDCLINELLGTQQPVHLRCLHNPIPLVDKRFKMRKQAMWHCMDLQADLDTLWDGIHDSARRAYRKAQRNGVTVKIADDEQMLRAFFELHLRVRKNKYHLIAQPYAFFCHIWQEFVEKGNGVLMLAMLGDTIIGGILFLEWQGTLFYKFNASSMAHLAYRPNNLLMWEGIKYAKEKGYTTLDFGLSDLDQPGLLRYKQQFASEYKPISFLQYRPTETLSLAEQQINDLRPQLPDLFTDQSDPDSVTEKAGDVLYRYFI